MALPATLAETLLDNDLFTEDEYFEWEARTPGKWEFIPEGPPDAFGRYTGTIQAKSGGTPDHSSIAVNLRTALSNALRGIGNRTCRVSSSDLKVRAGDGRKSYPDVSVICGPPQMYRKRHDVVTNPMLIAEVLSPSAAEFARARSGTATRPSRPSSTLCCWSRTGRVSRSTPATERAGAIKPTRD